MKFERSKHTEQIGAGAHKRVYHDPVLDPNFAQVEFRHPYTNAQAKSIFYLSNIVHELFPEQTVRVAQIGNIRDGTLFARTEYVSPEHDPLHREFQKEIVAADTYQHDSQLLDATHARVDSDKRVESFLKKYEDAGLLDNKAYLHAWGGQDAIYDQDSNFKFVDINPAWYEPEELGESAYNKHCLTFDPEKLKRAIDTLPIERKLKARSYYNRLMTLCQETGFRLSE